MKERFPRHRVDWAPVADPTREERELLQRYIEALERGDAAAMIDLMREDAFFAMPPGPGSFVGRETIVGAWVQGGFGSESFGRLRGLVTRVNGQPAVANYLKRPGADEYEPLAIDVLRIENGAVAEIVAFDLDDALVAALGLPRTL
jgi:SnoaL-like domain